MNYAIVENGTVTNIISLNQGNAAEFPDAVPIVDVLAGIGDAYADGAFYRGGVKLLTPLESAQATIDELDAAIVEYAYQNAMLMLGITEG